MRSVSRTGLLAAGFGLAALGGFVGGLLREQAALTALRGAAGEGSEDLVPWAVGSYRSRWTTFRISRSAAAPASSGSSTRQWRGRGKDGASRTGEGSLDLGGSVGVGILRARCLCGRCAGRIRHVRPAGLCTAFDGLPHQPGVAGCSAAPDGMADAWLSGAGTGASDGADGRQGPDPAWLQGHRSLRRRALVRAGVCIARRPPPRSRLQDGPPSSALPAVAARTADDDFVEGRRGASTGSAAGSRPKGARAQAVVDGPAGVSRETPPWFHVKQARPHEGTGLFHVKRGGVPQAR